MNTALSNVRYVALGPDGGNALLRVTPDGAIVSMRKIVTLTAEDGHWYWMSVKNADTGKWQKKKLITAKGYDYLRGIVGIHFFSPDTITNHDGKQVGNPYLAESEGMLDYVKIRVVGSCRGPSGNWMAQDLTFVFNFRAYLASDLFGKWHDKDSGAVQEWGQVINPKAAPPCPANKLRVPLPQGLELEVDIMNSAVIRILREHLEKHKFAERQAYSMAARNIMRKLLGLYYVEENNTVTVTIWPQADKDLLNMKSMFEKSQTGTVSIDSDTIEVERDTAVATEEDLQAVDESDDDKIEDAEIIPQAKPERTVDQARAELREAVRSILANEEEPKQRDARIKAACKLVGIRDLKDITRADITVEAIDKLKDHLRISL